MGSRAVSRSGLRPSIVVVVALFLLLLLLLLEKTFPHYVMFLLLEIPASISSPAGTIMPSSLRSLDDGGTRDK